MISASAAVRGPTRPEVIARISPSTTAAFVTIFTVIGWVLSRE
jgi:hypothetical protein